MASPNGSWRPSAALLDWAFAHGGTLTPIGELVEPGTVAGRAPGLASGAAQPLPANKGATQTRSGSNRLPVLPPWIGVVGLIAMVGLFGTYTVRGITRKRR
jgi:D-alanyl-D-alanine carboxypeptidase (penicillin-binding protein 5/6)